MKIECPNCQEECRSDLESIPPDGIQIECQHCQFSFTMRDQSSDKAVSRVDTPAERKDIKPGDIHVAILKTRKKVPFWVVDSYRSPVPAPSSCPVPESAERNQARENAVRAEEDKKRDIPMLVDDGLAGDVSFSQEEFMGPAAPKRMWTPDATYLRRQKLKRVAIAASLLALLFLALFLVYLAGPADLLRKAIGFGKSITAILPLGGAESGKLHISNLNGDFIARGNGKTSIFVVNGKVTNGHGKACASIQVKGILFDEHGRKAAEETVSCGNAVPRRELQYNSEDQIRSVLQNPVGSSLSNLNIKSGTSIDFMLVFFDPPERLSEFSVEIAGYNLRRADAQ